MNLGASVGRECIFMLLGLLLGTGTGTVVR